MIPVVRVSGSAAECGEQYGAQASERVRRSIDSYRDVFAYYAGWDWDRVRAEARRFADPIAAFRPGQLETIAGIARGARVEQDDVLAINVRTEVMYAATARVAAASTRGSAPPLECTAMASVADPEHVVVAQNWDWLTHAFDTIVRVEAAPDDGPRYVTVVEAGLLAKFGMNSAGLGLCTNALNTDRDLGTPGVPYHCLLSAILGCHDVAEAVRVVREAVRSSSANYLLVDRSGAAVDIEALPGGPDDVTLHSPDARGALAHTNHLVAGTEAFDIVADQFPTSIDRLDRCAARLEESGAPTKVADFAAFFSDHEGHPHSVCCHPDPAEVPLDRGATIVSAVMDLTDASLSLADGPPCQATYERTDYREYFAG